MKKVGKTARPFRYDLNQIPYNYTVEVIDRVSEELWTEVCDCTGGSDLPGASMRSPALGKGHEVKGSDRQR